VYFHNADDLVDGQNISVVGTATVQSGSGNTNLEDAVVFTARTSVVVCDIENIVVFIARTSVMVCKYI
jgi:hypothetical protein